MALRLCIVGSQGRMGHAVAEAAAEAGHELVAKVDQGDDLAAGIARCDVVIDFSFHTVTESVFSAAIEAGKPVVCGTTGHTQPERERLLALAANTATVWAGNFSIGVNLLVYLVEKAAEILPPGYNAEIVEMHHRLKKDAPSGTALMLADAVLGSRGLSHEALTHGRHGVIGERPEREVGMHSLRGGDVVGDHTAIFAEIGERIELTHKASSRAIFARGAVRAAEWVLGKDKGVYGIREVLGLK